MGNDTSMPPADAGHWPAVTYESLPWERSERELGSRRQLRVAQGPYLAAVPPSIAHRRVPLSSEVLAMSEDASHELTRFDAEAGVITVPFASILLRTESASSSEVENVTSSAKQVALAEIGESSSANARLVVGNVQAMEAALALAERLDTRAVISMHAALLERHSPGIVGQWRDTQVWIGGGSVSPHTASFVPPHHTRVAELMNDVMEFGKRTDVPVLAQTAVMHAQFETIHPFPDGNGRTGRALIQGRLRAGRITRNVTVPVSAGLLSDLDRYFDALSAFREGELAPIVTVISEASFAAVTNGRQLVADIEAARSRWDDAVKARVDSSVHRLKNLMLRQPIVTATIVARELAVSSVAAQSSIDKLVEAGVLSQAGGGQRFRRWQAHEILDALDAFGERAQRRR